MKRALNEISHKYREKGNSLGDMGVCGSSGSEKADERAVLKPLYASFSYSTSRIDGKDASVGGVRIMAVREDQV